MSAAVMDHSVFARADDHRVLRARNGDAEAFTALTYELEELLYQTCYRILRHRQAAEGATQETLLNAWRRIEAAPPHAFRPWMFRIAINSSITQLRRVARRAETPLDAVSEVAIDQPTPDQFIADRELREIVVDSLALLPEEQRETMVLRYEGELGYVEIAGRTRTSVGTVKSRLHRGRRRLAQLIAASEAGKAGVSYPRWEGLPHAA
jgi:RNA polymerase sigma-70 factor (ECF subfamily)